MEVVIVGSPRWYAIEDALNEQSDCLDKIDLMDAVVANARMYRKPSPVWSNDDLGVSCVEMSAIIHAVQNYTNMSADDVAMI